MPNIIILMRSEYSVPSPPACGGMKGGCNDYLITPPLTPPRKRGEKDNQTANYIPSPLIKAEGIEKRFAIDDQPVEVLRGIDLTLFAGETVAIVGPSGAGKSTLLHILGLLEQPSRGALSFQGVDVRQFDDYKLAELRLTNIGFVFQFHHLLPEFTAQENVMLPALMRGLSRSEAADRAAYILAQVGLKERLKHKPGELSGGEQQRTALARALINAPQLILADEPTGNLDADASQQLRELLWSICVERQAALIVVTHNTELAAGAARRLTMRAGRLYSLNT